MLDTRSATIRHELGPATSSILRALQTPTRRRLLALEGVDEEGVGRRLEELVRQGLVFQEGDRYVSLVVEREVGEL